jgi:ankyrin repeat protein
MSVSLNDKLSLQSQGWTALHHASTRGNAEVVTVLVAAGAQINAQDRVWSVGIRVDLFVSERVYSSPSCLLARSFGGDDCTHLCWGFN